MMQGRRRDINETEWDTAQNWDYGKMTTDNGSWWYCVTPDRNDNDDPMLGNLSRHTVTEHEDGTISVSPSILMGGQGTTTAPWHGFLERGVWREV
jgi:hypothetical protein